jgi:hypothetical protein
MFLTLLVVCVPILTVGLLAYKTVTKLEDELALLKKNHETTIRQYNNLAAKYNILLADYRSAYIKLQKLQK